MKILEFAFRNICSYGNKLQSFTFTDNPRLILVQGNNGSGKSSISDALAISIYGKSAIRMTKEIPNRSNKNAYTYVKFLTDTGRVVEIQRGLEPNFSKVLIDDADYNLPDKRRVDDLVEDELTKIPFNVFSNTISLSINDFKSFVKLSPNDKRQIIDKIFGLDIVNEMSKVTKVESKLLKDEILPIERSIATNQKILETSVTQLESLRTEIQLNNDAKISELNVLISQLTEQKETKKSEFNSFSPKLVELKSKIQNLRDSQNTIQTNILEIQKKLHIYSQNRCPHCLSDLTDELHSQIKDKLLAKKNEYEQSYPAGDIGIKQLEESRRQTEKLQNDSRELFYKVDADLASAKKELSFLSIPSSKPTDSHLTSIITQIKEEISINQTKLIDVQDKLSISQEMEHILSDSGMKRVLMSQIIPLLNKKILKTSKFLDFRFAFEFDMDFDPIITDLGIQISPSSLSVGEQKKMNLIVLLGILELILLKHNRLNVLFLDEIFSSLDVDSIYKVVDLLKTFSKKYGMTIFVISNDFLPEEYFDNKISVKKVDNFSDMVIT